MESKQCEETEEKFCEFSEMSLDLRLLNAISSMGWKTPTLIQEKAIPLALEGNDILGRARTGTGKSAAFAIPIINSLLSLKKSNSSFSDNRMTSALVLAPTKELCNQLTQHFKQLTAFCSREITVVDISTGRVDDLKAIITAEKPDIIVGTPSRVLMHIQAKHLPNIKNELKFLVVDESDLMFSFGYEQDLMQVLEFVPKIGCQTFLMSATLNPEVKNLKKLILHNPVILKLEEPELPESDHLIQYHIQCEEEDKFVLINSLFKLNLIRGKTIIFVNSVDRCYKLKLFLEQFGIKTCILNSELPIASRCFIVNQFNNGVYDIIIASDEKCVADAAQRKSKKFKSKRKTDEEYGVSRGIDFKFVSNVINFDFPTTVNSYTHRVGRAARGHESSEGTVLSLISPSEEIYFESVRSAYGSNSNFKPYQFKMEELEAFKYRSRDALRAVTSIAIREARIKEIKREILTSQTLKSYFEEHPKDQKILKHDKALHTVKHKSHLKDVPEYIVPPTLQSMVKSKKSNKRIEEEASLSYVPKRKRRPKIIRERKPNDPLKTFKFHGFRNKTNKSKKSKK
jgi:ATP-dependent RNA helicase DDX56/DBP9